MECIGQKGSHEKQISGGRDLSQEYTVRLQDKDFKIDIKRLDEGGLLVVSINGQSYTLKPTVNDDGSITVNDTSANHTVKILQRSGPKVRVELDGISHDLEWERVRKAESPRAGGTSVLAAKRVSGGVYAPMPGKITDVRVKVGDTVKSGQTLCILEAMKMFNELKSPQDGKVVQVNVQNGSAVTPNDVLVLVG